MSIYDYDPDQKPKTSKEDRDLMMKKFLEKGGKVQKLEPGYPTNVGSLDKSKKPAFTREDIKEGKTIKLFGEDVESTKCPRTLDQITAEPELIILRQQLEKSEVGTKLIEDIQAGDTVVGYDGKPVSVLQKHCYKEDPKNTFYNVKIEHDNKVGTVDVGGWHRILNVPAPDIKENVINKEEYKGVEFSYDLLTEDTGYRIDGIPVNSMINELIDLATKINNK